MTDIFPPETAVLVLLVSSAYFLVSWAPVIWPLLSTHKVRRTFPRRWLFILTILSLSYGLIIAILTLLTVPVTAYSAFVAPQLSATGFHGTDWLVRANNFFVSYWWLMLPPVLFASTFFLVRKLQPAWPSICAALAANNSVRKSLSTPHT